jgi:hypothetical protein
MLLIFIDSVETRGKHTPPGYKTNQLMLCKEIVAAYFHSVASMCWYIE